MRGTSITRAMLAAATAALLVAGCGTGRGAGPGGGASSAPASSAPADNGVAQLNPDEIMTKARAALKAAGSFRVKGLYVDDEGRITLDFKTKGDDLIGSMAKGKEKIEVLAVAGSQYMRANEAFWVSAAGKKAGKQITTVVGDRWLKVPGKDKDFADLFSAASIDKLLKTDHALAKGKVIDVEGVPAISMTEDTPGGATMYVATIGEPYPLRVNYVEESAGGLDFSDFKAAFPEIKKPAAADVLDLKDLQNG